MSPDCAIPILGAATDAEHLVVMRAFARIPPMVDEAVVARTIMILLI